MPYPGYITGSMFNACLTKTVGKVVMRQCVRIACERLGVWGLAEQFDLSGIRAIEWGNETERLAIRAYEADTFTEVHSQQMFGTVPGLMVGGHTDGLVGEDGMVEVKCPNSDNHLMNITQGLQVADYINQDQAYLWVFDRQWVDFCSFDPRFPDGLQLYKKRLYRDEKLIAAIKSRAAEMETIICDLVKRAESLAGIVAVESAGSDGPVAVQEELSDGELSALLYSGDGLL